MLHIQWLMIVPPTADFEKEEWFKTWFDTTYYHQLYHHRDMSEASLFIDNLLSELELKRDSMILDLACGHSRHAYHLSKKEFEVTGIDLSPASISFARETCPDVFFHVHDMRKVMHRFLCHNQTPYT